MAKINAKIVLSDPAMRALLNVNNYIAARDLTIRIIIEIILIGLVCYSIQDGSYILAVFLYYTLAIWHSFWGYAGIGHELMHGRVFSSKGLNNALYYLASSLVWSNALFFKDSHLHHHAKTFSEDDAEAKGIQNWGLVDVIYYLIIDIPFMVRRFFYTFVNSFGFKYANGVWLNISRSYQVAAIITFSIQVLIGTIIYFFAQDILINVLWILLPFVGQLINKLLAQSQHVGLMSLGEFGPLKHSRSIRLPRLVAFLYAGMNYHAEHHLIPSIPYYNLAKASEILVKSFGHKLTDWRQFYMDDFIFLIRNNKSDYARG